MCYWIALGIVGNYTGFVPVDLCEWTANMEDFTLDLNELRGTRRTNIF